MGVNTWLMKGFFDTIPTELDESARVDGATPAQIFWGVDPAARRARARGDRPHLVRLHAERVRDRELRAADGENSHAARRPAPVHRGQVRQELGAVRRRRPPDRDRADRVLFFALQRYIVEGLTGAPSRDDRHGDTGRRCSRSRITTARRTCSRRRTSSAARRSSGCACRARRASTSVVAALRRATASRASRSRRDRRGDGDRRLVAARASPSGTRSRATAGCLAAATSATRWVNGLGVVAHDVPDADDFVLAVDRRRPDWHLGSVVYEIFPDRFASSGAEYDAPAWAVRREWDELPDGPRHATQFELLRRRPARDRRAARPHRVARRERGLPDADLPGRDRPPLRRDDRSSTSIRCSAATRRSPR